MIADLGKQLSGIGLSVFFGVFLGVVYDILRLIRIAAGAGKGAAFFFDLFFCFLFALASFTLALGTNYGYLRFYHLGGEALGMLLWFFTLGKLFRIFSEALLRGAKRLKNALQKLLRRVFGAIRRRTAERMKKIDKKVKKLAKKG